VAFQIKLKRHQQTNYFFLVDLHWSSNGVAVRRAVQPRRRNQIPAAQEQPGALRPAQALAAGKGHQVEAELNVFRQVDRRRQIGRGIVESRNSELFAERDELFAFDLAQV